jgi:hypothetical protein
VEHFVLRLFLPFDENRNSHATNWALAMGKVICFLFMNSFLASLMYADDGYVSRRG